MEHLRRPHEEKMLNTIPFFAHEFGQSISGYTVYVKEGWSTSGGVLLTAIGYVPMFLSAAVIFAVSHTSETVKDAFDRFCPALATGFFLYIVLADMVPDVVHYHVETKWYNALAMVTSLLAVTAMIVIIPHSH
jgi:zinc transporter ZupT